MSRVHFCGHLPYQGYLRALQISSAHIYLTYPFTLSWSLLEAMSAGCLVIGSDTAPLRDVINEQNGILVPFFGIEKLAERIVDALADPIRFHPLRSAARRTVVENYDLATKCLPALSEFVLRGNLPSLFDKAGSESRSLDERYPSLVPG
jgi:glycosyltransferase involved in cell wall biosynthesis